MRGAAPGARVEPGAYSLTLRALRAGFQAYSLVFAASPAAGILSRSKPVRHTGFELELRVEQVRREADDVVSLTLVRPEGGPLPAWIPGAHLDVFLPSGRQRQYSLSGDPAVRDRYRIAVRRIADGGGGSREIHDAVAKGDMLTVRGPRNAFPFIESESYLFIAAGIGITPILPMVRAASARGARWRLIYLGRSRPSMPFRAELATLEALSGGRVDVRPDDEYGRPDIAELLGLTEPGSPVYLCGPSPLLDAARASMPQIDSKGSLHVERFSAPPVAGGAPFTIELARSGRTIEVAADETALAAIRRERPDVRYSCQQGYCGTCKVRVLVGAVDHRDQALMPHERAEYMTTCVSRAGGDSITLDL